VIATGKVNAVLEVFRLYRVVGATVYLRPGSSNIINGIIGLAIHAMAATTSITASSSTTAWATIFNPPFSSLCY
jgi:hypothetical protein